MQTLCYSSWHQTKAQYLRRHSIWWSFLISESCRCFAVSHIYLSWHLLCCPASVPSHAFCLHQAHACIETHLALCSENLIVWFASLSFSYRESCFLDICWLRCMSWSTWSTSGYCVFLVITWFHSLPRDNLRCLVQVKRLSIGALLIWFQNHVGSTTFSRSFISPFLRLLWYTMTMLMQSTYPTILFSINILKTLRLTFTLFERRLPIDIFTNTIFFKYLVILVINIIWSHFSRSMQ